MTEHKIILYRLFFQNICLPNQSYVVQLTSRNMQGTKKMKYGMRTPADPHDCASKSASLLKCHILSIDNVTNWVKLSKKKI